MSTADDIPTERTEVPQERTEAETRVNWVNRRREKIVSEIERNQRGDHKVPTWVLVAILVVVVAAWAAVVSFA